MPIQWYPQEDMANYFSITETDLAQWSERYDARSTLPILVRKLIATLPGPTKINFSGNEGVDRSGYDGTVETQIGDQYVPTGQSVWEVSVNGNPSQKANEDYAKRTADSSGYDKSKATFVFVTPRKWSKKDEWAEEKKREGHWADVRVYDASDLEQWIEKHIVVETWFGKVVGKHLSGVIPIDIYWQDSSSSTNPPIPPKLLTEDREEESQKLLEWLNQDASVHKIQAPSQKEALLFFIATILCQPDEFQNHVTSKALIVEDSNAWRTLIRHRNLILIPLFLNPEGLGTATANNNHVLLTQGGNDRFSSTAQKIPRLSTQIIEKYLAEMGFASDEARSLAKKSGRSLMALFRKLAIDPAVAIPVWASHEHCRKLLPLLLLGGWKERYKQDLAIVEKISKQNYADYLSNLSEYSQMSESPVLRIVDEWQLNSFEDSWSLLAGYLTNRDFDLLEEVAVEILSTIDPKYELPADKRWAASVYNKPPIFSENIREGVVDALALMATHANLVQDPIGGQARASRAVKHILDSDNWQLWASLDRIMPTLAEASPTVFLDLVENKLKLGKSPIPMLFVEEEGPTGGSANHSSLLWSLEGIAWNPDYLARSALVLAKLSAIDPGGRWSNRPINSLWTIFLPACPHTMASAEQRLDVLDMLVKREPNIGWELLFKLWPTGTISWSSTHKPEWREWATGFKGVVTTQDYFQSAKEIIKRMIVAAGNDIERWKKMIAKVENLPEEEFAGVVEKLETISKVISGKDKVALWNTLRGVISKNLEFHEANWALPAEAVDRLEKLYLELTPEQLVDKCMWLFEQNPSLLKSTGFDYVEKEKQIAILRDGAIDAIFQAGDLPSLWSLISNVELPHSLGGHVGRLYGVDKYEEEIVSRLIADEDKNSQLFLFGYFGGRFQKNGWKWIEQILGKDNIGWDAKRRAVLFKSLPPNIETWEQLSKLGAETEDEYWQTVFIRYLNGGKEEAEFAIAKLMEYGRPYLAIELAGMHAHPRAEKAISSELLVRLLEKAATVSPKSESTTIDWAMLQYRIQNIFEAIYLSPIVEESRIFRLELTFFPFFSRSEKKPKYIFRELSGKPTFFVELVSNIFKSKNEQEDRLPTDDEKERARLSWGILNEWKEVPTIKENNQIDREQLLEWCNQALTALRDSGREVIGAQCIGKLFAHSPVNQDGIWPHQAVCEIIEELDNADLELGMEIEIRNKRGCWSRALGEGGKQERQLANYFRQNGQSIAASYPRTASVLLKVAEEYERQAKREDEEAEKLR